MLRALRAPAVSPCFPPSAHTAPSHFRPPRVAKLPMDAPDHSWIDPDDVPVAFLKHFAKQQRQQEGEAQQQQQQAGGASKDEL